MAKNTVLTLAKQAAEGKKVTMVTSYDYTMASIVEAAGINMILVGDSLGMTMLGYEDTIPVTTRAPSRARRATPSSLATCPSCPTRPASRRPCTTPAAS